MEQPLHNPSPAHFLPHRFPFLQIDRIISIDAGKGAQAEKLVTEAPEGFPVVLLIECIAQLAGIAAGHEEGEGGFLASIDHAEFHGQACAGDLLELKSTIIKSFGRLCLAEGSVSCAGRPLLTAQITLGIGRL